MSGAIRRPRRRWHTALALLIVAGLIASVAYVLLTPLRRTDYLQPTAARTLGEGGDPNVLMILSPWDQRDYCPGEFSVGAAETDTVVSVSAIRRVSAAVPLFGGCAGAEALHGQVAVELRLGQPLGSRTVVRAEDGSPLPVLEP
ncbi:hypothetical protein SAMN06266982_1292 [Propioniciclava tarda]|nr:hypothetical protein SAMN06266982_1292 [Propioniciclava tarda]